MKVNCSEKVEEPVETGSVEWSEWYYLFVSVVSFPFNCQGRSSPYTHTLTGTSMCTRCSTSSSY